MVNARQPLRAARWCTALLCACEFSAYGCGPRHADFRPVEGPAALGPGHAAVYYDIEVGGRNYGDVRIWSPGAYPADINGERRVIHVQLRMRNDGDAPLILDVGRTYLEVATRDWVWMVVREEARVEGNPQVAPGETQRIQLYYPIPADTRPRDVEAFELNWRVRTPAGDVTHSTPFAQDRRDQERWRWVPAGYWGTGFRGGGLYGWPYYWY